MKNKCKGALLKKSFESADNSEGIYANTFKVGFNEYEVVLDFGQYFEEKGEEKFHTRIISNAEYMKQFHALLGRAIKNMK